MRRETEIKQFFEILNRYCEGKGVVWKVGVFSLWVELDLQLMEDFKLEDEGSETEDQEIVSEDELVEEILGQKNGELGKRRNSLLGAPLIDMQY